MPLTAEQIVDRILTRIDDNETTPVSVTQAEALAAVNEGQQLFAWLTLCLETTGTLTFPANTAFGTIRNTFPDFLCPLRVAVNGVRLRPATLANLDAMNDQWQATPNVPSRYVTQGFNFWAISGQQTFDLPSQWTYAQSPVTMTIASTPQIPVEYHPALVSYGIYRVKLKEGGQGLARGVGQFNEFLDAATEHGDFVRGRSRAARYDTLPFELKLFDRARLMPPRQKRPWVPAAIAQPGGNSGNGGTAA